MKLGLALPFGDIGGDAATVREFAQIAEELGYDGLTCADHVLGVNAATRQDWGRRATSANLFHDPFVLFGYLAACTRRVEFSTQVMILPQRQTVLVAKQAASLDVLSNGRFRFGIGVGWNEVEFVGLNENFKNRGKRSEEQIAVMRALWAEPHVTFKGKWHTIDDAGINPLPLRRDMPIWFGGHVDVTFQRIAKWGQGWMMLDSPPSKEALAAFDKLRRVVEAEGRDPASVGIEVWTSVAEGDEKNWREEVAFWQKAGVTHITLHNTYTGYHHKRMPERTMIAHVDAARRYIDVVSDLL